MLTLVIAAELQKLQPIRIGVSSCLLGQKVRFDGGDKRDPILVETLGRYFQWVSVCPEVELGLGVPRPTMRLVARDGAIRLIEAEDGRGARRDHTAAMRAWARRRVAALDAQDLSGYVLKKNSPSCGMDRVPVYRNGTPTRDGRGLFAEALLRALPNLPVEEEGRLSDPAVRDHFVERVFAYHRLRTFFSRPWKRADLFAFHTAHQLQLLAHTPGAYERLGRLVAGPKHLSHALLARTYEREFMAAIRRPATRARHVGTMRLAARYLPLDASSRRELDESIANYRSGLVPLIVPLTLIRHHAHRLDVTYLKGQAYLEPDPLELMLRNHA